MKCVVENKSNLRVFAMDNEAKTTSLIKTNDKLEVTVGVTEVSVHGEKFPIDKVGVCTISGDDNSANIQYTYDRDNEVDSSDGVDVSTITLKGKKQDKPKVEPAQQIPNAIFSFFFPIDKQFNDLKKAFDLNQDLPPVKKLHWNEEWIAGNCAYSIYSKDTSFRARFNTDPILNSVKFICDGEQPQDEKYFDHTRWGIWYGGAEDDLKTLYIAFRGTFVGDAEKTIDEAYRTNFVDALTDACAVPHTFYLSDNLKGKFKVEPRKVGMHGGFYATIVYNLPEIIASIQNALDTLNAEGQKVDQIILTGHSLGGALANVLNTLIFLELLQPSWSFAYPIHAITFAAPHFLYYELPSVQGPVLDVLPSLPAVNFIHNYDIVPQLLKLVSSTKVLDAVGKANISYAFRLIFEKAVGADFFAALVRSLKFSHHYTVVGETNHLFAHYTKAPSLPPSNKVDTATTEALGALEYSNCYSRNTEDANNWFLNQGREGRSIAVSSLDDHSMAAYLDCLNYVMIHHG